MATLASHLYCPMLESSRTCILKLLLPHVTTSFSHPTSRHKSTVVELGWFGQLLRPWFFRWRIFWFRLFLTITLLLVSLFFFLFKIILNNVLTITYYWLCWSHVALQANCRGIKMVWSTPMLNFFRAENISTSTPFFWQSKVVVDLFFISMVMPWNSSNGFIATSS